MFIYVCAGSVVSSSVTPWTGSCQAPPSTEFSRQEYWSGLPFPPPRDLRDPEIEPGSPLSPALQADSFTTEPPGKPKLCYSLLALLLPSMLWPAL